MARMIAISALALFVAQASGTASLLAHDEECAMPCPGDEADGDCPPGCQACACCSSSRTLLPPAAFTLVIPGADQRLPLPPASAPQPPDPDEILHVPIFLAA